ncbi:trypsin-like peptidase domain-containing protein [Shewanella sp. M16]|uniref:PKD domain-containing protein n=1 Tax=Shewanella sp. M16 TaxID=2830837 RepID=UPI001BAF3FAC|nr:PKD domain-containing protein [Shewanella sp. M16]MBS0045182.1 trypsin-like peptidase domain-containing protein [Shewanella sp. M16]
MKLHYLLSAIVAVYGSTASANVDERQILRYAEMASETSKVIIGERAPANLVLNNQHISASDAGFVIRRELSHLNADYIKLHFTNVQLSNGAKLVVRSPDNSERYEYTATDMRAATLDAKFGDDGIHSFSVMSISNDSAIIEYYPSTSVAVDEQSEFGTVDSYFYGTESVIQPADDPLNDVSPLSTCGVNERKGVQCWADSHPIEFERSRPIARLVIGGRSLCTGWRVGADNKMFTNNHCVETAQELASTEVWFNYQNKSCNGNTKETIVKVTGNEFFKTDYTLDYTLFSVNNFTAITQFGHLGLEVRDALQGELIYIPQHGSGNPKELAIESDQDSNGLCQVNAASTNGRGSNTDIGYNCDTIGGSSGSPVIAASSNNAVALHHLGGCYNKGAKISKIWPQVSDHFNGVVPIGDNVGNIPTPTARFTYSCDFELCSFNASGSSSNSSISHYDWNFGDNQIGAGEQLAHTFAASGTYDVSLTVLDSNNQSDTLTQQVSVTSDGTLPNNELVKGQPKTGITGGSGSEIFYYIDVPMDASNITIRLSGGIGDADLYVKKDSKPTSNSYDCRPFKNGNNESCTLNSGNGRYHVMLKAYRSYSGVSLVADYTKGSNTSPADSIELGVLRPSPRN